MAGRQRELERLRDALFSDADAFLLTGGAGLGKSRLISEGAQVSAAQDAAVLVGRCLPLSSTAPLLPLVDILRALSQLDTGRVWKSIVSSTPSAMLAELRPVASGLIDPRHFSDAAPADGWQMTRLFEAARYVLAAARADANVAIVVEDIHWADADTRDFIEYLLAGQASPLPTVLTLRSGETYEAPVEAWLGRVRRFPNLEVCDLLPLAADDAGHLVRELAGAGATPALVTEVVRRAQGNPFFIQQLVSYIMSLPPGDDWAGLPQGLASLLLQRIRDLRPLPLAVMEALSLLTGPGDERLLVLACSSNPEDVHQAVRDVMSQSLVVDRGRHAGYEPTHQLLREAICSTLTDGQTRRWHRRLADALSSTEVGGSPNVIAEHYKMAQDDVDELKWRVAAGRLADNANTPVEAAAHWERAVALSETTALPDDVGLPELYSAVDGALRRAGRMEETARLAERGLARLGATADPRTKADLLYRVGLHRESREPGSGVESLWEAVALYETLEPTAEYLSTIQSFLFASRRDRERSSDNVRFERALRRAIDEAPRVRAPGVHARILTVAAILEAERGEVDAANARVLEAQQVARDITNPYEMVNYATFHTDLLLRFGLLEQAVTAANEAGLRDWTTQGRGEALGITTLRWNAFDALTRLGRTQDASQVIDPVSTGTVIRDNWLVHLASATLEMLRGDLTEARRRWRALDAIDYRDYDLEAPSRRAEFHLWDRNPHDALTIVFGTPAAFEGPPFPRATGQLLLLGIRAHADAVESRLGRSSTGEPSDAHSAGDRLCSLRNDLHGDPFTDELLVPTGVAHNHLWEAEWSRASLSSDPDAWRAAATAFEDIGRAHPAGYAYYRLAEALLARGTPARQVAPILRQAGALASGHDPLRRAVLDRADRARVDVSQPRTTPLRAANIFGLTPRELDVLELLGRGASNREIAAELFISESTAGVHVGSILRKLRVENRRQAAAIAFKAAGPPPHQ